MVDIDSDWAHSRTSLVSNHWPGWAWLLSSVSRCAHTWSSLGTLWLSVSVGRSAAIWSYHWYSLVPRWHSSSVEVIGGHHLRRGSSSEGYWFKSRMGHNSFHCSWRTDLRTACWSPECRRAFITDNFDRSQVNMPVGLLFGFSFFLLSFENSLLLGHKCVWFGHARELFAQQHGSRVVSDSISALPFHSRRPVQADKVESYLHLFALIPSIWSAPQHRDSWFCWCTPPLPQ